MRHLALIVFFLLVGGCGRSSIVPVSGSVTKSGVPFGSNDVDHVVVTFWEINESRQFPFSYPAFVKADGKFTVTGPVGDGIPPGSYRVCFTMVEANPTPPPPEPKKSPKKKIDPKTKIIPEPDYGGDKLKKQFALENTPFIVELTRSATLTFDLDNPPKKKD